MAAKTPRRTPRSVQQRRSGCLSATASKLAATVHPHDPRDVMTAAAAGSEASGGAGWIRSSYRLLMIRGLSSVEAGNLVAYLAGLHAAEGGWTTKQIEQLVALRSLVACGVIAS